MKRPHAPPHCGSAQWQQRDSPSRAQRFSIAELHCNFLPPADHRLTFTPPAADTSPTASRVPRSLPSRGSRLHEENLTIHHTVRRGRGPDRCGAAPRRRPGRRAHAAYRVVQGESHGPHSSGTRRSVPKLLRSTSLPRRLELRSRGSLWKVAVAESRIARGSVGGSESPSQRSEYWTLTCTLPMKKGLHKKPDRAETAHVSERPPRDTLAPRRAALLSIQGSQGRFLLNLFTTSPITLLRSSAVKFGSRCSRSTCRLPTTGPLS